ncbi:unnamed protein product [Brachionus calyciflorus]|uniref:PDZ domain-containing protein n=1 Tax=Brachionus calyciflorus TaxID=104777 RepID=A0A814FHA6_9BILA|nr:unnamed protein product [Brachionus calyciflorus]
MIRTDNLPRKIPIPTLLKFKIKKDGPYEFVLEEFEDKIIITGIFEGGIIYKHGGPKVGDELLDVNNIKIKGKSLAKSVEILEHEISDSNRVIIVF